MITFDTVLIANRGAIACRIIRTLRRMGIRSIAVFSEADAGSLHVAQADDAVLIGPALAAESYLNIDALIAAAKATGAQAIHPGYGFLSESAIFAERCAAEGIVFIGPTPDNIRVFGLKHTARALASSHGVPLAPGTDLLTDEDAAIEAAERIGYPVMLKATAGGGGIGMTLCANAADVGKGFATVARLGKGNFGDSGVFLEHYVATARHIEVQIFGDGKGRVVALGERDCSMQRRNQKVLEETPAPLLPAATRAALIDCAVRLASGARYLSAGTVEFLYDAQTGAFFFLEVNTRLQVEHGITEQVTGVDLVEWMVRGAAGDLDFLGQPPPEPSGASIEVRLYAEDPAQDYRPSSGRLIDVSFPDGPRVDSWVVSGTEVSAFYDPMLAKLIVTAPDRPAAIVALQQALDATRLVGIQTNLDWLRTVVRTDAFVSGQVSTRALSDIDYKPRALRILSGGAATTVQDYPGRIGYWNIGVPPSGPMDSLAFRLGNRLVGNNETAAGLEITAVGPAIMFMQETRFVLTGADFGATLDGSAIAPFCVTHALAGQMLKMGRVTGCGIRGYLMVAGGIEAPSYLGSKSTFTLGEFGGHAGRAVAAGDLLFVAADHGDDAPVGSIQAPSIMKHWTLRVLYGPHGAPDFFTPDDIAMIATTQWQVHFNSNRTGIRLTGPKPVWARRDGGEAGLHPSNIHDNPYAIGAVDFTGDMPIILGPDGPSLGGFVCPFVVIHADLWMLGQLAPGDSIAFEIVDADAATAARRAQDAFIQSPDRLAIRPNAIPSSGMIGSGTPVLRLLPPEGTNPQVTYRQQGDRNLLVEYGPITLDLELRLRVHALMMELGSSDLPGIIDVTPGIRSLQIHYDSHVMTQAMLLDRLEAMEKRLDTLKDFEIPSRIVHLPLSWGDPAIWETIDKYTASVRNDAPWCPDNIEFIRRINGLETVEDVRRIVFDAHYLVMGLGDVYLGAPVATPVDPRHRLVTTKYNPARTWTPPNVVGIGGAYMCIYGMEGPGGYQLFGRTIQIWNSWRETASFAEGKPWLLRFFDQIRFFPVTADELVEWRRDFPLGRRDIRIEDTVFRLSEYRRFLADNAAAIGRFETTRRAAFDAERDDWQRKGEFDRVVALAQGADEAPEIGPIILPEGCDCVDAPFGGTIWNIHVSVGDLVREGETLAIVEAMKTESAVASPFSGRVKAIYINDRQPVSAGMPLFAIEPQPA
jgi:urea carboxylase